MFQQIYYPSEIRAQSWNSLLNYLGEKDKSTVEKDISSLKNAGELTKQANEYYNNASELQTNYDLEEETLQKKLKKEESKAISAQLKADKIYSEANKSVLNVCRKVLQSKNSGEPKIADYEKDADDLTEQAKQKRNDAKNTKNVYEKATLLNDASGLEAAAIENMISAIMLANGDSLNEEQQQLDSQSDEGSQKDVQLFSADTGAHINNENIVVNNQVLDKYNNYVSDPNIPGSNINKPKRNINFGFF